MQRNYNNYTRGKHLPQGYVRPSLRRNESVIPQIQLVLSEIKMDRFVERPPRFLPQKTSHNHHDNDIYYKSECPDRHEFANNEYGPPKFQYKCLDEKIVLYLIHNCQISIPLSVLRGTEKVLGKSFRLIFRESAKSLVEFLWNDDYTDGKKRWILENFRRAESVDIIVRRDQSENEIDVAGLHIDYVINKMATKDGMFRQTPSWGDRWTLAKDQINNAFNIEEHMIIKLHSNKDTRIFLFPKFESPYTIIKRTIEEALYVSEIDEFKYRDDSGEFITISTPHEFDIALKLYAKNNKLELWYMTAAKYYGNVNMNLIDLN